jgi:hypothetical protein
MGCVLRAFGSSFEPDAFLKGSALSPSKVWRKGEPRVRPGEVRRSSGVNIAVSDADMADLRQQARDAIAFLQKNKGELARLVSFPGVEGVGLDFGIAWKQDVVTQTDSLPPELVRLAGELGLGVEISH